MSWELPDVSAGFRKSRGVRDQTVNICWIIEKAREFQKTSYSLTMLKPLTVWITENCGKFLKRWEYQTTVSGSLKVKKQQLELDMKQLSGSKLRKSTRLYIVICLFNFFEEYIIHNVRLNESQAGIKISRRNINNLRYADDTTLMEDRKEELKGLFSWGERREWNEERWWGWKRRVKKLA